MSHFTVLVIGNDPEKQLAPYHEFECTGADDEHVVDVDVTAEVRAKVAAGESLEDALDWYGLSEDRVEREEDVDKSGRHKYGYAIVTREGELVKAADRTNPNKKWDWYVLGGRWTGYLKMKPDAYRRGRGRVGEPGVMTEGAKPGYADQARKCDVDFEGMQSEAEAEARAYYRKVHETIGSHPFPELFTDARVGEKQVEQARNIYWAQPAMQALRANRELSPFLEPERFKVTEDEYAQRARAHACVTFALVRDGKWFEKGEMGWWGIVLDEKDEGEWVAEFEKLLAGLAPDTLLSVYDCHI